MHFERNAEGQLLPQPGDTAAVDNWLQEQTSAHSIDDVRNVQKRNLDQWCFAEHLDSNVLQQVCWVVFFYSFLGGIAHPIGLDMLVSVCVC